MEQICVLMSTYNGEKYIKEQLDSIFSQKGVEIILIVRDDGSTDKTVEIISEYFPKKGFIDMPNQLSGYHNTVGIGSSFFSLLRYAIERYSNVNFFAFADQDDVWCEEKICRGVDFLAPYVDKSALYFCRKRIVDQNLNYLFEDTFEFHNNFSDYLTPNQAYGCTMMLTRKYAQMLLIAPLESFPQLHDIIVLKTAICTQTFIVYDKKPMINYRQHSSNAAGYNNIEFFKTKTTKKIFKKRRHYLKKLTKDILKHYNQRVLPEIRDKLIMVEHYENPVNAIRLLIYYMTAKRTLKEKIHFLAMVVLRGI